MTKKVRLLGEAVAEVEDAAVWCEEQAAGLGLAFPVAVDSHWHADRRAILGSGELRLEVNIGRFRLE